METIGDSYMVASGVPVANSNHASDLANMALDIIGHVTSFQVTSFGGGRLQVRIGLNSGPVVGAVVGRTSIAVTMMIIMMMIKSVSYTHLTLPTNREV